MPEGGRSLTDFKGEQGDIVVLLLRADMQGQPGADGLDEFVHAAG